MCDEYGVKIPIVDEYLKIKEPKEALEFVCQTDAFWREVKSMTARGLFYKQDFEKYNPERVWREVNNFEDTLMGATNLKGLRDLLIESPDILEAMTEAIRSALYSDRLTIGWASAPNIQRHIPQYSREAIEQFQIARAFLQKELGVDTEKCQGPFGRRKQVKENE